MQAAYCYEPDTGMGENWLENYGCRGAAGLGVIFDFCLSRGLIAGNIVLTIGANVCSLKPIRLNRFFSVAQAAQKRKTKNPASLRLYGVL